MDDPAPTGRRRCGGNRVVDGIRRYHASRRKHRDDRGNERETPRHDERLLELGVVEDELTDDRPDADPAEDRDREVARSLGPSISWRQVRDQRGSAHEHRSFADAHDAARDQQLPELADLARGDAGETGEQCAADEQNAASVPVGESSEEWPGDDRRTGEDRDREPDAELAAPQWPLDEQRHDRDQHPDVDEEHERRGGDDQERTREQTPVRHTCRVGRRRHPAILPNPTPPPATESPQRPMSHPRRPLPHPGDHRSTPRLRSDSGGPDHPNLHANVNGHSPARLCADLGGPGHPNPHANVNGAVRCERRRPRPTATAPTTDRPRRRAPVQRRRSRGPSRS